MDATSRCVPRQGKETRLPMPSNAHRRGWQTTPADCPGSLTPSASSTVQVCPCGRDRCSVCIRIIDGARGLSRVVAQPNPAATPHLSRPPARGPTAPARARYRLRAPKRRRQPRQAGVRLSGHPRCPPPTRSAVPPPHPAAPPAAPGPAPRTRRTAARWRLPRSPRPRGAARPAALGRRSGCVRPTGRRPPWTSRARSWRSG